jgi:branched-chain amino acid transport system substrate-binding protein
MAILGTTCSGEAQVILPAVSAAGVSMVSPSNTAWFLTDPGTPGYFRVSWNDAWQGEVAAEYAISLGLTKAATIDDGSSFSVAAVQSFASTFGTAGRTITAQKTIAPDQVDMRTELTDIASGTPEMVYFPITMPAGGFVINQARVTTGLTTVRLMASDRLKDPLVMLSTGSDLQGFLVTAGADTAQYGAGYPSFVTAYTTKFGVAPSAGAFAPYGYDAFNLVKAAIQTAAVDVGSGAYLIGRQALRDALRATSGMAGLTGTLTCESNGECSATPALAAYRYTAGVEEPSRIWP